MNQKIDIESLIKSVIKEEGLESPSVDFSEKIMSTIKTSNSKVKIYEPLIPGSVLKVIFSSLALVTLYIIFTSGHQTQMTYFDNFLNRFKSLHIDLEIPANISYIIISALIMLMIQVIMISKFYRKMQR